MFLVCRNRYFFPIFRYRLFSSKMYSLQPPTRRPVVDACLFFKLKPTRISEVADRVSMYMSLSRDICRGTFSVLKHYVHPSLKIKKLVFIYWKYWMNLIIAISVMNIKNNIFALTLWAIKPTKPCQVPFLSLLPHSPSGGSINVYL